MEFSFKPLSNLVPLTEAPLLKGTDDPLGPLGLLRGKWSGTGFNQIWRPFFDPEYPDQHHFLELNLTVESIKFTEIDGDIPNRGLLQGDLIMHGLQYLQIVNDNFGHGLHLEPGVWLNIPATTNPEVSATVARLGSVPHGTSILGQGTASSEQRAPVIAPADITAFKIGDPSDKTAFPESDLSIPTRFRSPPDLIKGITQAMVDNPNSVLTDAIANQKIINTTNLFVTTASTPVIGGGTANTAFLGGGPDGPNADAAQMTAIFWIEEVEEADGSTFLQLQYTQTVLLDFRGRSWPHVSVGTLRFMHPSGG
ncbi:MAG: heme-binding protein [Pseudomonadota bacterium]